MVVITDSSLSKQYNTSIRGYNNIIKKLVKISDDSEDTEQKIAALKLAKECHQSKVDLLANIKVVNEEDEDEDEDEDEYKDEYKGTTALAEESGVKIHYG